MPRRKGAPGLVHRQWRRGEEGDDVPGGACENARLGAGVALAERIHAGAEHEAADKDPPRRSAPA